MKIFIYCSIFFTFQSISEEVNSDHIKSLWETALTIEKSDSDHLTIQNGQLYLSDPKDKKFSQFFYQKIDGNFTSRQIRSFSIKDNHLLFITLNKVSFYTQNQDILDFFAKFINAVPRRNQNISKYARVLQERYIASWMFDEAREIGDKFGLNYGVIPYRLIGNDSDYRQLVSFSHNTAYIKRFVPASKAHIIVVGSVSCNPSNRFTQWLENNQELKSIITNNATWITKQNGNLKLGPILEFNRLHPHFAYSYVYKKSAWSDIKLWDTPTLYFYKENGDLAYQLSGWPPEGSEELLREGLKLINLS